MVIEHPFRPQTVPDSGNAEIKDKSLSSCGLQNYLCSSEIQKCLDLSSTMKIEWFSQRNSMEIIEQTDG